MSKKYSVEDLRKQTQLARQNRSDDYSKACSDAFDHIILKADEQIQEAMNNGRFRAYLYIWHYVEDQNDRQYTFNNIRMLDIVSKGDLIDKLRNHFDSELLVDWHKFKNSDTSSSKYGIYVSWAEHKPAAVPATGSASATAPAPATSTVKVAPKPAKAVTVAVAKKTVK